MIEDKRSGFVAVIGAPNAGKSTLVNRFVGSKITIVSHKVQTTRSIVRGICVHNNSQIVFIDTPGIFEPKRRLDRSMVDAAWRGTGDADVVALLYDTQKGKIDEDTQRILKELKGTHQRVVLVLNKIDMIDTQNLLPLAAAFEEAYVFDATFMISAASGEGSNALLEYLAAKIPSGAWLYPEDEISDLPERLLMAEITREQVFLKLHQELPYSATVETDEWSERNDGAIIINQTIYVRKPGHKKIALGRNGTMIQSIGTAARIEMQNLLQRSVHLFLFVKVRKNWMEDPDRYKVWGLNPDV